jgi:hypothetical protein
MQCPEKIELMRRYSTKLAEYSQAVRELERSVCAEGFAAPDFFRRVAEARDLATAAQEGFDKHVLEHRC